MRSPNTAGRAKSLSPAECARVVARYQDGATVYELAAAFEVHRGTIARRLKAEGIKLRSQPLSKADAKKTVELYISGQSLLQIGAQLGRHHSTIWHVLNRAGVQMRDSHGREVQAETSSS
jgi:IS30 family transposase